MLPFEQSLPPAQSRAVGHTGSAVPWEVLQEPSLHIPTPVNVPWGSSNTHYAVGVGPGKSLGHNRAHEVIWTCRIFES